MTSITKKGDLKITLDFCLEQYRAKGMSAFISAFQSNILACKIRFPLLEYCAEEMYVSFEDEVHIAICDRIAPLKTIGGNVILGILLKKRLANHFEESISKAADYIVVGDEWFCSDIIGERVQGNAILLYPKKALPALWALAKHDSNWVVRSIGAACHLATKRGLKKTVAINVFELLLHLGGSKDYQIQRGIGWAAKTMAKFHPDIITQYSEKIQAEDIGNWFRRKVNIGLERYRYGQGEGG